MQRHKYKCIWEVVYRNRPITQLKSGLIGRFIIPPRPGSQFLSSAKKRNEASFRTRNNKTFLTRNKRYPRVRDHKAFLFRDIQTFRRRGIKQSVHWYYRYSSWILWISLNHLCAYKRLLSTLTRVTFCLQHLCACKRLSSSLAKEIWTVLFWSLFV